MGLQYLEIRFRWKKSLCLKKQYDNRIFEVKNDFFITILNMTRYLLKIIHSSLESCFLCQRSIIAQNLSLRSLLRIWSHLLKKSLMENFIFCAVYDSVLKTKRIFSCMKTSTLEVSRIHFSNFF